MAIFISVSGVHGIHFKVFHTVASVPYDNALQSFFRLAIDEG